MKSVRLLFVLFSVCCCLTQVSAQVDSSNVDVNVLEGEGKAVLDDEEREVRPGAMVHIPAGVVHGAIGQMRVLVVGIPDIDDSDVYYPE